MAERRVITKIRLKKPAGTSARAAQPSGADGISDHPSTTPSDINSAPNQVLCMCEIPVLGVSSLVLPRRSVIRFRAKHCMFELSLERTQDLPRALPI